MAKFRNIFVLLYSSATEIEWRYTEQGERVRVSKRTGRIIPKPMVAQETYEFKSKATYRGP